jgi:hypothetical protein
VALGGRRKRLTVKRRRHGSVGFAYGRPTSRTAGRGSRAESPPWRRPGIHLRLRGASPGRAGGPQRGRGLDELAPAEVALSTWYRFGAVRLLGSHHVAVTPTTDRSTAPAGGSFALDGEGPITEGAGGAPRFRPGARPASHARTGFGGRAGGRGSRTPPDTPDEARGEADQRRDRHRAVEHHPRQLAPVVHHRDSASIRADGEAKWAGHRRRRPVHGYSQGTSQPHAPCRGLVFNRWQAACEQGFPRVPRRTGHGNPGRTGRGARSRARAPPPSLNAKGQSGKAARRAPCPSGAALNSDEG